MTQDLDSSRLPEELLTRYTPSQRALHAARQTSAAGGHTPGIMVSQAAKAAGVTRSSVSYARTLLKGASPAVIAGVEAGSLTLYSALKLMAENSEPVAHDVPSVGSRRFKYHPTKGVGLLRATEAINSLSRIPKDDPLRPRGLQMVEDWIKHNR